MFIVLYYELFISNNMIICRFKFNTDIMFGSGRIGIKEV